MVVPVPDQLEFISIADGVTRDFPYPKRFLQADEIKVLLRDANGIDTPQYLGQHFSIAGSSWPNGGAVSFYTAPAVSLKVVRYRMTQAKQTVDLENKQRNDAKAVEAQLDRTVMAVQDRDSMLNSTAGGLKAEIAARIQGGELLNGRVDQEITDRKNGDNALASLIGQSGPVEPHVYESVVAASHANIKPMITNIKTGGFADPKDLGGANYYKKSQMEPNRGGDFTSVFSGERWGLSDPFPNIIMFGGASGNTSLNDAAFIGAQDYGKPLYLPDGEYHASFVPSIPCYGPGVVVVNGKRLKGSRTAQRLKGKYKGQVATRCGALHNTGGSAQQFMSRTMHQARDHVSSLQVIFPNWWLNGTAEVGSGNTITVTAAIEYPEGEFHQVTWGGSTSVNIPDLQNSPASDPLEIDIPDGATFFVRSFQTGPSALVWTSSRDTHVGEASRYASSGLTDLTMGGAIINSTGFETYRPIAIISDTTKPSVLIIGDSREYGLTDVLNSNGDKGYVQRSISDDCAFINVSRSGDQVARFIASHDLRVGLGAYCSHVVVHMGTNDLHSGGATAEALRQGLETIAGYFPDQSVWTGTIEQRTTSTDGWATLENQTGFASNVRRVQANEMIRSGLSGFDGYFDFADVLESSRNSNLWRVWAGKPLTDDGTHANRLGNQIMEDSGVIDTKVFFDTTESIPKVSSVEAAAGNSNKVLTARSLGGRPKFSATKAGVDQVAVPAGISTLVTYNNVLMDVGRYYDPVQSRWTPPKGVYVIRAQVFITDGLSDGALLRVIIRRNGGDFAVAAVRSPGTGAFSVNVDRMVTTEGGDYFDVAVNLSGVADKTISGSNSVTYFEAFPV